MKNKLRKWLVAGSVAAAPALSFADGETNTTPGLTEVNSAITSLQNAATAYAGVILPYIVAVGLAFIGISVVYLLFKVFRRFVGGK